MAELSTTTPTRHKCVIPESSAQIFQHLFTIQAASQKKPKKTVTMRSTKSEGSKVSATNKGEDNEKNETVAGSSKNLRKRDSIVYGDQGTPPPKFVKTGPLSESSIDSHNLLRRHNLQLSRNDLLSLGDAQFLNDQIIDFWLLELNSRLSEEDRNRTHIFSTFFYKRLTNTLTNKKKSSSWESNSNMPIMEKRHCRVKKWTKNVDLFSKDFIIIPVNEDSHWYLAIICFPGLEGICNLDSTKAPYENKDVMYKFGKVVATTKIGENAPASEDINAIGEDNPIVVQPCILIFDSLQTDNQHQNIYQILRQYLQVEYLEKKKTQREFDRFNTPGYQPNVPQQPNYCDCGIFLISYVEAFFNKPIKSYWLPISNLWNWFSVAEVHTKRKEVYDSIVEFIKTDAPENMSHIPQIKFL